MLAQLQSDYELAEHQGTWRDWVELIESKFIVQDKRILKWLQNKLRDDPEVSLRPLARSLRNHLKDMHTHVLDDCELYTFLEQGWQSFRSDEQIAQS
jgi:hypothetical protein